MQFKDAPIIGNFATNFSSIKKRKGFYIFMDNSELTPDKLIKFSQYYSQFKGRRVKEWIHRKVSNFGIQGKLISAFCGGKLFVAVKVWYPMKEKVGSEFYMYRKKYADIYDTYALFTVPDC